MKKTKRKDKKMFRHDFIDVKVSGKKGNKKVSGICSILYYKIENGVNTYPEVARLTFEKKRGVFSVKCERFKKVFDEYDDAHRIIDIYTDALMGHKHIWTELQRRKRI